MQKKPLIVLAIGVFGILNTEMGIIGILPQIAAQYSVSLTTAGLLVSLFALAIAVAGPVLPMLLSRFERKKILVAVLALFTAANFIAALADDFYTLLAAHVLPAFLHPVFVSFALAAAADFAGRREDVPKAVAIVLIGVSTGMVLGVPLAGLLADAFSLQVSLLFFAVVTLAALAATAVFIPQLPKVQRVSYGSQLGVLKEKQLWLALTGVVVLNGSVFGVFSYVSSYLAEVLGLPAQLASALLLVYGLMNILGNAIAGKGLAAKPERFIALQPAVIIALYVLLLLAGSSAVFAAALVVLWGIAAGMVCNTIQYWVSGAAPKAPEFANGLYLTAANIGTSAAAIFCGFFIDGLGIWAAPLGGIVLAVAAAVCVYLKICLRRDEKAACPVPHEGETA